MSNSREKRVTLRFYLDDPMYVEAFDQLMRRHRESGIPINTLIVEAIHKYLCQEDSMDSLQEYGASFSGEAVQTGEDLEKMIRSAIRSEGDALLRKWSPSFAHMAIEEGTSFPGHCADRDFNGSDDSQIGMAEEEADNFESLSAAMAFCSDWG